LAIENFSTSRWVSLLIVELLGRRFQPTPNRVFSSFRQETGALCLEPCDLSSISWFVRAATSASSASCPERVPFIWAPTMLKSCVLRSKSFSSDLLELPGNLSGTTQCFQFEGSCELVSCSRRGPGSVVPLNFNTHQKSCRDFVRIGNRRRVFWLTRIFYTWALRGSVKDTHPAPSQTTLNHSTNNKKKPTPIQTAFGLFPHRVFMLCT